MSFEEISEKMKRILAEKSYRTQIKQGKIWICCPFHDEKTPSCSVTLQDAKYLPGTFYCFGCGAKGSWNKLAEKFGSSFRINTKQLQAEINANLKFEPVDFTKDDVTSTEKFLQQFHKFESFTRWPEGRTWRGISSDFLKKIDAYMLLSQDYNIEKDDVKFEQMVFLPVKVNGIVVGGISAPLDRKKYLNTPGDWVKTRGLFPFDVAKKIIKNYATKFVVLVEGPRDAARLISDGIPALAILGSKNWTEKKRDLLLTLCSDDITLVLLFDSDEAGQFAQDQVKSSCKNIFRIMRVTLPEYTIEEGKRVKCDVFNLSEKRFSNLIKKLNAKFG